MGKQPAFYDNTGTLARSGFARVTTILAVADKPELDANNLQLAATEGLEAVVARSETAAEKGTLIHEACELYINKREEMLLPTEFQPHFEGFKAWVEKYGPTHCNTEVPLRSEKHKYAGRADLLCTIDGEEWIVDIKTSKVLRPTMGLQLAAYRQAYYEEVGTRPRTGILQLTDTIKRGYRFREYKEPIGPFLALKKYYDWQQKFKKPAVNPTWDGRTLSMAAE